MNDAARRATPSTDSPITSGGTIRANYTTTGSRIGSAQSTDGGATWTQDAGYRLSGQAGYIDPTAVVDTDGSILLYFGYVVDFHCDTGGGSAQGCTPIRLARSTDGLTCSVYAGNVLPPGAGPIDLQDPDVFLSPDGQWRMLFGEYTGGGPTVKLRLAERQ